MDDTKQNSGNDTDSSAGPPKGRNLVQHSNESFGFEDDGDMLFLSDDLSFTMDLDGIVGEVRFSRNLSL